MIGRLGVGVRGLEMPRIFISYSRADQAFATQLATALSDGGADVWIDVEDIPAGFKWSSAIQEGLDTSDAMLVIVSPDSMTSRNVEDEWQYFLDNKRTILTVRHRPAKMHYQLHRIQYVDFHGQAFEHAFWKLVTELDRANVKGIRAPKPPSSSARPTRPAATRPVAIPYHLNNQGQAVAEPVVAKTLQTDSVSVAKTVNRPKSEPKVARPMPPAPPSDRLERLKQPAPLAKPPQPWWKRWAVWATLVMLGILIFQAVAPIFQR